MGVDAAVEAAEGDPPCSSPGKAAGGGGEAAGVRGLAPEGAEANGGAKSPPDEIAVAAQDRAAEQVHTTDEMEQCGVAVCMAYAVFAVMFPLAVAIGWLGERVLPVVVRMIVAALADGSRSLSRN